MPGSPVTGHDYGDLFAMIEERPERGTAPPAGPAFAHEGPLPRGVGPALRSRLRAVHALHLADPALPGSPQPALAAPPHPLQPATDGWVEDATAAASSTGRAPASRARPTSRRRSRSRTTVQPRERRRAADRARLRRHLCRGGDQGPRRRPDGGNGGFGPRERPLRRAGWRPAWTVSWVSNSSGATGIGLDTAGHSLVGERTGRRFGPWTKGVGLA